jgi:hypothetical protein
VLVLCCTADLCCLVAAHLAWSGLGLAFACHTFPSLSVLRICVAIRGRASLIFTPACCCSCPLSVLLLGLLLSFSSAPFPFYHVLSCPVPVLLSSMKYLTQALFVASSRLRFWRHTSISLPPFLFFYYFLFSTSFSRSSFHLLILTPRGHF